jgi:hypothetical protein
VPAQTVIQLRRDTAVNWTSANPVLSAGEAGYELDTNKLKVGDGTTSWSALDYLVDLDSIFNSPTLTGLTDFQGIVDFSDAVVVGIDALPDQTGNDGKYLTTDGNTASWQTVASPVPHPFVMIG